MKLDYKKTLLIGFGFLAVSIAWSVYNAYVPLILQKYMIQTWQIGAIMTLSNVFGAVFDPIFGNLSDKTTTKFGRRLPFIVLGIPVCAAAFFFIPFPATFWSLLAIVIIFNFFMSTWRSPVVALMPDLTPSHYRSQANGIINFMGGIGTLIALLVGGILYNWGGMHYPFALGAVVMIGALTMLMIFIREPMSRIMEIKENPKKEDTAFTPEVQNRRKKSLLSILIAIFFWFVGFSALETFFTLYVTHTIRNSSGAYLSGGDASLMLAIFPVAFLAFAIPAGFIGARVGRKKVIMIALFCLTALFATQYFANQLLILYIMLVLGGVCWAFISVNALPMVVDMTGFSSLGKYTGYYYMFSLGASIVSPVLFGLLRDLAQSYQILFIYSAIAFTAAFICMLFVSTGDGETTLKISGYDRINENE